MIIPILFTIGVILSLAVVYYVIIYIQKKIMAKREMVWIKTLETEFRDFDRMQADKNLFESDIYFESESYLSFISETKQLIYMDDHGETHLCGLDQISEIAIEIDTLKSKPTISVTLIFIKGETLVAKFTKNLNHATKFLVLIHSRPKETRLLKAFNVKCSHV